jgi:hypothetical protein
MRQNLYVEYLGANIGLSLVEQIEQQRGDSSSMKHAGVILISSAIPPPATAQCKQHNALCTFWDVQEAAQLMISHKDFDRALI